VKDIVAENSLVVEQKFKSEFQCFDSSLNSYLDRCLDTIKYLHTFTSNLIPIDTNSRANCLDQQASGCYVIRRNFLVLLRPMLSTLENKHIPLDVALYNM
jgi:hypothetical protein